VPRRLLAVVGVAVLVALVGPAATRADGDPLLTLPGSAVEVDVENTTSGVAWFSVSAVDGLGNPLGVSCDPSSGSSFPLGTTTVTCSASDGLVTVSGSFDVVVRDPTSPTLDLPTVSPVSVDGATTAVISYSAGAADAGSPVPVSCSPASGASFPLGTTHVSCSATDGAGNTSTGGFDVTVADTTPPKLSLPGNITAGVNGASTKVVTFSATASDGSIALTASCAPASGSGFPLGTTTVSCSATDAAGNSTSGTFTVTVQDTTPPAVSITSAPGGTTNSNAAAIAFTASEGTTSCQLDGGSFASCSSPASLSGLADGAHTFAVRAEDAAHNTASASATWTVDTTSPALTLPSAAVVAEADGPAGGNASYTVTGADNGTALLPSAIGCSPRSGSKFPLGTTHVECHATDAVGNVAFGVFSVVVRDTTPPAINAPNVSLTATSGAGIHKTDGDLAAYLSRVQATDLVSTPTITNNAPDLLPVGGTAVTFTATDAAGNVATKRATITVLPVGKQAPAADLIPPANPSRVGARSGDHRLVLSWLPTRDTAYVTLTLSVADARSSTREVYRGSAHRYTAKGLRNGASYRILLVAWDRAGNRSKGVVVRATPKAELLGAPKSGQRVTAPVLLRWAPVAEADYFNVQLWRGTQKLLSAWPSVAHLQLPRSWTYDGKKQKLAPGVYTWYVWPGIGARADAHYGALLGSRTFVVVARNPAV